MDTRREFIKKAGSAAWMLTITGLPAPAAPAAPSVAPWYRRITRWGQVNITEKDPQQYDIAWWRAYWKRTNTRGII
ncbi:MAG TPA: hypothetical protein VNW04_24065, partial [Puia sp.]|nr:hypothetical protein [Puia sp.]